MIGNNIIKKNNIIVPLGDTWLQCVCGHREFAISVFPSRYSGKIRSIVCMKCEKRVNIDMVGNVGGYVGDGKLGVKTDA